jgi:seryl-tRNA synthetase
MSNFAIGFNANKDAIFLFVEIAHMLNTNISALYEKFLMKFLSNYKEELKTNAMIKSKQMIEGTKQGKSNSLKERNKTLNLIKVQKQELETLSEDMQRQEKSIVIQELEAKLVELEQIIYTSENIESLYKTELQSLLVQIDNLGKED